MKLFSAGVVVQINANIINKNINHGQTFGQYSNTILWYRSMTLVQYKSLENVQFAKSIQTR